MNYNSNLHVIQTIATIQGEGDLLGVPSILIRLVGCNCRCSWCDSPWSWSPKNATTITPAEMNKYIAEVLELAGDKIKNLMITGGEPLLYKNNDLFKRLINLDHFNTVEIETNGALIDKDFISILPNNVKLNISPKFDLSWYTDEYDVTYHDIIKNLKYIYDHNNYIIKFVDDPKYHDVLFQFIEYSDVNHHRIPNNRIYIMPLTPNRKKHTKDVFMGKLKNASLDTLRLCMEHGFNFVPRLHLYLFDDEEEKI